MQYFCPTCAGELFIDESGPRSGTPCPLCRTPLWFLRTPSENGVVLTFLAEGKRHAAGVGFSTVVLSSLQAASSVMVDLSRLHSASSHTLEALAAIHERLQSIGGRMELRGVKPEVAESIEKAGLGRG